MTRTSAIVGPLIINKGRDHSRTRSSASRYTLQSSGKSCRSPSLRSQSQISPPLTPRTSREHVHPSLELTPVFHNYIRAFYHFHPSTTVSSAGDESSITVPINQGDVILVHSIHPNGWADGTLVADGSRGWLPTNYCEVYDPSQMQKLLTSLTHLWDLVRVGENGDLTAFAKQDYVRGMIGGVRFLLETSQCLTRDDLLVQSHEGLRKFRKGLLGDLSTLVKTAKKLQALLLDGVADNTIYDMLDDLVFKALKLVARAVRFLDLWTNDAVSPGNQVQEPTCIQRPLTPPNEIFPDPATSTAVALAQQPGTSNIAEQTHISHQPPATASTTPTPVHIRTPTSVTPLTTSPPSNRWSTSHRVSYNNKLSGVRNGNLASERLCQAHDSFLGFIGSFIGIHLQSRSAAELLQTTQQSVLACEELLAVVDAVWERDRQQTVSLYLAKTNMRSQLVELVKATRALFNTCDEDNGDDFFTPDQGKQLVAAATDCVRAAGECVTSSRCVIEIIGDFDFEYSTQDLATAILQNLDHATTQPPQLCDEPLNTSHPPPEKPLPERPSTSSKQILSLPEKNETKSLPEPPSLPPVSLDRNTQIEIVESPVALSFRASNSDSITTESIPTSSKLAPAEVSQPELVSPTDSAMSQSPVLPFQRFFGKSFRTGSVIASVTDSCSTYPNSLRGDNASIVSHASTRATTPEQQPRPMTSFESFPSEVGFGSEECSMVEDKLLETTFVHELVYNKDGHISGGSLAALVEQLTLHDSTPDPMFVNTFYLTFRLFTTPLEFANSLMQRFDYVGDSSELGLPVRLRIFNVFKGWLESHWQSDSDTIVLDNIVEFAMDKLQVSLPAAGRRLAELAGKVAAFHATSSGAQLLSHVGKTSTSSSIYAGSEKDAPTPIVSKSQMVALKNARLGAPLSIMDLDPLELARQFTIIESSTFCAIQPEELLSSKWTKKNGEKAPNVRAMSTLSTDLANLVADSILSLEDAKKRALIIKKWVKISMKCLELNNYDSLMAIICSLNSSMVLRLKRTWELVSQKNKTRLEELKKIVDVGRNYAILRQRLQNHEAPCIPFVGIYLTDLTFVDVGNQTTRQLPNDGRRQSVSVINFDKHIRTAKIIGQLQRLQVPYNLTPVPEMQDWLEAQIQRVRTSDQANVQNYYRRSLLLEPRQAGIPNFAAQDSLSSTTSPTSVDKKFDFMGAFSFSTSVTKEKAT
ncbi:ras GEF [Pseudovirgaria hyperparasitica]|uniref:Ras GEF n=1 Tax=Pseudovirgaria hyperparasitica TaxID=470096 RepID=A0A6A6WBE6_9PEZI|nr:ras GEF [Pseudovirgaria hyperparasitica]KAF2759499.1 ras GEF [Pseudovirgaria hyperparasitica]